MDPGNYFNQANYQNVPSDNVNWAQLAQRWIMTRPSYPPSPAGMNQHRGPATSFVPPPLMHANIPPGPSNFPRYPPPLFSQGAPLRPPMNVPQAGFFNAPNPAMQSRPWRPMGNSYQPLPTPVINPSNFSKAALNRPLVGMDGEEYKAHYDASLEQDEDKGPDFSNDVPVGAMSHWFSGMTETIPTKSPLPSWMMESLWSNGMPQGPDQFLHNTQSFTPLIDHQMRKKLPAWILEGLDKAEKEKQKKAVKEQTKRSNNSDEVSKHERRAEKRLGKFDSDSDEEGDKGDDKVVLTNEPDERRRKSDEPLQRRSSKDSKRKKYVSEPAVISKEEALLAIRKMMTSVLLEATDNEIKRLAKDILAKELANAKRKGISQNFTLKV